MVRFIISMVIVTMVGNSAIGQDLIRSGMLATETMSRTRLGGSSFQLGDMMYVTVLHPGDIGAVYVSAHMEYLDEDQWRPVPTSNDDLGKEYTSGHYPGLRDYVRFDGVRVETERHVCLFMPYEAASLRSDKSYRRRYVIRLWDRDNDEVKAIYLPDEPVEVRKERGKTIFSVVRAKACKSSPLVSQEPVPESRRFTGIVRFFNARSGEWICPSE